jgi:GTP-binding protein
MIENNTFQSAEYYKSALNVNDILQDKLPEIAFVGRSNVGKSSLLNALTGRKNIARISSTPGKTKLINFFLINKSFYFVDLPGYGFSKESKRTDQIWQDVIEKYLIKSKSLRLICLLLDSRHDLQENDSQMINWLTYNRIPFYIILTKVDKLSGNHIRQQIKKFEDIFPDHHIFPVSTAKRELIIGLSQEILNIIN